MGKKTVKTSLPTDRTMYKLIQALKDVAVYPEVIDNLNSTDTDKPLSANQGKVISGDLAGIRGSADAYDPDNTDYAAGDPCINNNILYIAKQAITHPAGSFDAAKWTESSLKTLMEGATANSSAINAISAISGSVTWEADYVKTNHRTTIVRFCKDIIFISFGIELNATTYPNKTIIGKINSYTASNIQDFLMIEDGAPRVLNCRVTTSGYIQTNVPSFTLSASTVFFANFVLYSKR